MLFYISIAEMLGRNCYHSDQLLTIQDSCPKVITVSMKGFVPTVFSPTYSPRHQTVSRRLKNRTALR